ncbi:hypothetical protein ABZ920_30365 [Streptomyces sp. NPDC046831]|uniref:hypothetical protein n=1 Tax=Streptomyces sp. NPDC046831 TaxID=3154805 RepID=UPI0033E9DAD4
MDASVLLPIGDFPKVSQVDFSITVAGEQVHRISREFNGQIQARYFRHLAQQTPLCTLGTRRLEPLLAAIFTFNPGVLRGKLNDEYRKPLRHPRQWNERMKGALVPVRAYVENAIDVGVRDAAMFDRCDQVARDIGGLLDQYVLSTSESAAEYPLLALPELFRANPGLTERDALRLLKRLHRLLVRADQRRHFDSRAERLLHTYFSYGRRWEALAWCKIPLNASFLIEVYEKREIFFDTPEEPLKRRFWLWRRLCDRLVPKARQYVAFADAKSNHVNIRVDDTSVQLGRRGTCVRDELNREITSPPQEPDDEHKTREYYSRYDSRADRLKPDSRRQRLWIECRLLPTWLRLFTGWGFIVATWSAICLIVMYGFIGRPQQLNSADILTILFPVTFGASLLLVQETTTLGRHIKRAKQGLLLFFLLSLWGLVFVLYVMGRVKIG